MKIQALDAKRKTNPSSTLPPGKAVLSVYVDRKVSDDLKQIAKKEDVCKSDLMRYIFADFIETYNQKK